MISPMAPAGTPICARVVLTKSPTLTDNLHILLNRVSKSSTLEIPNLIDPAHPIVPRPDDDSCDAGLSPLPSNFNEVTDVHCAPLCLTLRLYLVLSLCFPAPERRCARTASQLRALAFLAIENLQVLPVHCREKLAGSEQDSPRASLGPRNLCDDPHLTLIGQEGPRYPYQIANLDHISP